MRETLWFGILSFLVIAVWLREDFALALVYLLAGVFLASQWWANKALASVVVKRNFPRRAFLGERVPVGVELQNTGRLPVPWLQFRESIPAELMIARIPQQVTSLSPRGRYRFGYELECRKRGYYPVGPAVIHSGDLLGIGERDLQQRAEAEYLTVYPMIVPLPRFGLPSQSPLGTISHHLHIFEDPSRVIGKRDYVSGDSLRRVDWKTSAVSGKLQVKTFEPSIALETVIFLNLNATEYEPHTRFAATELAIVVAASIANWVCSQRQAVGLFPYGIDSVTGDPAMLSPARRGRSHLMQILGTLARVQSQELAEPFVQFASRESARLPWGTTLVFIVNRAGNDLFDVIFQARRAGLSAAVILVGSALEVGPIQRQAALFHIPCFWIAQERDLDIWRR